MDASEPGEQAANGLVNSGEERRTLSEGEVAYISEEGLESVLVGRDDLRNLKKTLDLGEEGGEARSERRPNVKREE